MRELFAHRVVLVAGKGGVGRSVLTAAIATAAGSMGKRVLVADLEEVNTRRRSPLARLFGLAELPKNPVEVAPGVDGVLIQTEWGTELFLRSVFRNRSLVALAMRSKSLQRLLHAAPSFREMGMFFHILSLLEAKRPDGEFLYDLLVADMPATGHTLAMTSLPEIMLQLISGGPVAAAFRRGQALLNNPDVTRAWVVTLPETLPVSETLELLDGLRETGVPIGGVLVNRLPSSPFTPDESLALAQLTRGRRFMGMRGLERMEQARQSLARLDAEISLPILTTPEYNSQGVELVAELATRIAGGRE